MLWIVLMVASGATCGSALAAWPISAGAGTTAVTIPTYAVSVVAFGANGNGVSDNTRAFNAAIAAVQQSGGGTVTVPPGTYAFTSAASQDCLPSVVIPPGPPVRMLGSNRSTTRLVEHVSDKCLLAVFADNSRVAQLTLDSESHHGGPALTVRASYTIVRDDIVLGQNFTGPLVHGLGGTFAIFYEGKPGSTVQHPLYEVGNLVRNIIVHDGVDNDGFSFSFQNDARIKNVQHTGSRLALYIDSGVTVINYSYTPNAACLNAADGFWITAPSEHIMINGFTSKGAGGIVSGIANPYVSTDISISGERLLNPGYSLVAANVAGLTVTSVDLSAGGTLSIEPPDAASGIVVSDSIIPHVNFNSWGNAAYTSASATFNNDTFPAYDDANGKPTPTFNRGNKSGATRVTINLGVWSNAIGGFSGGQPISFTVSNLKGYN